MAAELALHPDEQKAEQGQAVTEYLLLISAIVSFYMIIIGFMNQTGIGKKLAESVTGPFAAAYQYGHPKAKGPIDPGGPLYHPFVDNGGETNFRIFLNPRTK